MLQGGVGMLMADPQGVQADSPEQNPQESAVHPQLGCMVQAQLWIVQTPHALSPVQPQLG
jgi:hypothetical protein